MNFVYELCGCGFESRWSHLNVRYRAFFEQGVPWHSGKYKVYIHSETRTLHDKKIQWLSVCLQTKWLRVRIPLKSLKRQILCLFWAISTLIDLNIFYYYYYHYCCYYYLLFFSCRKNNINSTKKIYCCIYVSYLATEYLINYFV